MNLLKRFSFLPSLGALWLLLSTAAFAGVVETTFYHNDLSGSPVAATDDDGHLKWREEYRPYGERILKQAAASDNSRWYTSHPHDEETQLTYMGARFYDPVVGRFMGADPVGFHENNLVSFNRYAYASNNPYSYYDPNGESVYSTALRFVIKGGDVAATFAGVVEDTNTLLDSNASTGDRVIAFLSLASEVLPVSGRDVLDASNAVKNVVQKGADDWAKLSGQLRDAAKGKGNFGIGSGTREQAEAMGKAWVGDGYIVASDGKTLISADGLRQYRPPSYKPRLDKTQANFEQRIPGQQSNRWQSNAHLDITD